MNRFLGMLMLLLLIGAEVVGFARWIAPTEREAAYAEAVPTASADLRR